MDSKLECTNHHTGKFSFIHASDLHLGSHQYRNENRAEDFINAFKQVLYHAVQHQVDFILLGGDVFNSLEMLPGKLTEIISILSNFKFKTDDQIKIIAIEGNHDIRRYSFGVRFEHRGQSWLKLLAGLNLIILLDADLEASPEKRFPFYDYKIHKGGKIRIKGAIIYGTRYLGENPKEEITKIKESIDTNKNLFHVLLQHFGIEGQMKSVPGICYDEIKCLKERVDYLALGHFHVQFIIDDWVYNPGSTEATCTSDYFFKRGIFLVSVKFEGKYVKEVREFKLKNRKAEWLTISFKKPYKRKDEMYAYILKHLERSIKAQEIQEDNDSSVKNSCLFLKLMGLSPSKECKVKQKELEQLICSKFPFISVKIYQKYVESVKLITTFI